MNVSTSGAPQAAGSVPMTASGLRQVVTWRNEPGAAPSVGPPNPGVVGEKSVVAYHKDIARVNREVLAQVRWERHGPVGVVVLHRPAKRNAYTEIMRNEIVFCLDELANKDPTVRAVILTGASYDAAGGGGEPAHDAFCVGADLSIANDSNPTAVEGDVPSGPILNASNFRDGGGRVTLAILRCLKPVIAAVNGHAVGVGATMTLGCDVSVAVASAKIGFVFARRGLTMEAASSAMLARCVGHKKALELVLTGRVFEARDAPDGLFNYVLPTPAAVREKAMAVALEIAAHTAPMAAMLNRHLVIRNHGVPPEEAHLAESKAIGFATQQPDFREGVASFLAKRPPRWRQDPYMERPEWFPWWRRVDVASHL